MKKIAKMSLIAAVAVAGLTTTSSATDLTESIKNTDLTGYMRYRYTNGESTADQTNEYKIVTNITSTVSENVKAKVKVVGLGTVNDVAGDADPLFTIRQANFIINAAGATVIAGKQGLVTPFADADSQEGTGVIALYPVGPVTLAAGWYSSTDAESVYDTAGAAGVANSDGNLTTTNGKNDVTAIDGVNIKENNIAAVAVIGAAGPVNYQLWYANINEDTVLSEVRDTSVVNTGIGVENNASNTAVDAKAGAKAWNLNLAGKFGPVNVELNMARVAYTLNATAKTMLAETTQKQNRLVVSGAVEGINLALGMVTTGKEGGEVTLGDEDAQSNFDLYRVDARGYADGKYTYGKVGTSFGKIGVDLEHVQGKGYINQITTVNYSAVSKIKAEETKLTVSYAMAKNFKVSGFITDCWTQSEAAGSTKQDLSVNRVELLYTF